MGHSGSEHWRIDCQGERSRTMKPATTVKRTQAILLLTMMAAVVPSCQSEEERKDEAIREELRSAIEVIEKAQQDHIAAQREYVELHEKYKFEKCMLATKTPLENEREKLERIEKDNAAGWQGDIREKIDEASGEDLLRVVMELRGIGEKADTGKVVTESAVRGLKQRMALPREQRMP